MKLENAYKRMADDRARLQNDINEHYTAYKEWYKIKDNEEDLSDSGTSEDGNLKDQDFLISFMEILINDLAKQWDDRINTVRKNENKDDYLMSWHRFRICDHGDSHTPVLEKTKQLLPPDKRFSEIDCSFKGRNRIVVMSILHEMGHSIGKRQRLDRFQSVFLPLLAERLVFEISARVCESIKPIEVTTESETIRDGLISDEKKEFVHCLYQLLPELQETIQTNFENSKKDFIKSNQISPEDGTTDMLKEVINRQNKSVEMGFFVCCRAVVLYALSNVLEISEEGDTLYGRLIALLPNCSAELKKSLSQCFKNLCQECKETSANKATPIWYRDAEEILEETAADVFMLRICGTVSSYDYCYLLMESLQRKTAQGQDKLNLLEKIAMPSNLLRIISVCRTIESHTKKRFLSIRNGNALIREYYKMKRALCDFLKRDMPVQRIDAFKYLQKQYKNILKYMIEEDEPPVLLRDKYYYLCYSPMAIGRYFAYVDMIWEKYDEIFKEFKTNRNFMNPIKQIRKEVKIFRYKNRNGYLHCLDQFAAEETAKKSAEEKTNSSDL